MSSIFTTLFDKKSCQPSFRTNLSFDIPPLAGDEVQDKPFGVNSQHKSFGRVDLKRF
jgi:hypothetical protein